MVIADEEPEAEWLLKSHTASMWEQGSDPHVCLRVHAPSPGGSVERVNQLPVCASCRHCAWCRHCACSPQSRNSPHSRRVFSAQLHSLLLACDFLQTLQQRSGGRDNHLWGQEVGMLSFVTFADFRGVHIPTRAAFSYHSDISRPAKLPKVSPSALSTGQVQRSSATTPPPPRST